MKETKLSDYNKQAVQNCFLAMKDFVDHDYAGSCATYEDYDSKYEEYYKLEQAIAGSESACFSSFMKK